MGDRGEDRGRGLRIALVASRFHQAITQRLVAGAEACLRQHGVREADITTYWVPGAFEIPGFCRRLMDYQHYDAIIALGAVIRGATDHYEHVAGQAARGVGQLGLEGKTPVIFGILTTRTLDQALERAEPQSGNKGWEAALTALEMVSLYREVAGHEKTE